MTSNDITQSVDEIKISNHELEEINKRREDKGENRVVYSKEDKCFYSPNLNLFKQLGGQLFDDRQKLCDEIGKNKDYYSKIINGKLCPSITLMHRIAKVLKTDKEKLFLKIDIQKEIKSLGFDGQVQEKMKVKKNLATL